MLSKTADIIRQGHLWEQTYVAKIVGNITAAQEIKQLLWIEDTRKSFKKLAFFFKKWLRWHLTSIKIPPPSQQDSTWITISDRNEMENQLSRQNKDKTFHKLKEQPQPSPP